MFVSVFVRVRMRMRADIRRHVGDVAVAHAALGDNVIRKRLHVGAPALEHRDLETAIVVEMNMKRRLREVVVRMEVPRQTLGQFALLMVVDIAQCRNAVVTARHFET